MGLGGDDTARGEARWHGVCLAVAEMARRGLVQDEAIDEAVQWAIKVRSHKHQPPALMIRV